MRRLAATAALVLTPVLLLTACGSDDGKSKSSASASPSADMVTPPTGPEGTATANATFGGAPNIKVPPGTAPPKQLTVKVLTEGTGPVVDKTNQTSFNYDGVSWSTGLQFDGSFDQGRSPLTSTLDQGLIPGWMEGIPGHKVGSRLLLTIPPDKGYGTEGRPPQIKGNETLVFVVDILGSYGKNATAKGTAVPQNDPALPTVQTSGARVTGITVPPGKQPPTTLVSKNLINGTGATVTNKQNVAMQWDMVLWDGGKKLMSTWNSIPTVQNLATLQQLPGLADALNGKKVGSRVLVVLPPDKAWGAGGSSELGVPANATVVMVIDVLGAF